MKVKILSSLIKGPGRSILDYIMFVTTYIYRTVESSRIGRSTRPSDAESIEQEITGEFRLFDTAPRHLNGQNYAWHNVMLAMLHTDDSPREPEAAPVFEFLNDADVDELAGYMELRSYTADTVIRFVQPFGGIYFIRSGRVELAAEGKAIPATVSLPVLVPLSGSLRLYWPAAHDYPKRIDDAEAICAICAENRID